MQERGIALLLGFLFAVSCGGQSPARDGGRRTTWKPPIADRFVEHSYGITTDIRAGLEWTSRDNARDVTWPQADRYCRELALGGQTGWRLPAIGELERLYDESLEQPCGVRTCHLDPAIRLSSPDLWSATQTDSRRLTFDFRSGASLAQISGPGIFRRALCVRRFGH